MARRIRLEISICDLAGDPVALWHSARTLCDAEYDDAAQALHDMFEALDLQPQHPKLPKDPPDDPETL